MNFIAEYNGRTYYYHILSEEMSGFLNERNDPFVALIHVDQHELDESKIKAVAEYLLQKNLRYIVCAGTAAKAVEAVLDQAIAEDRWDAIRGETIMTTQHEDEPPAEVLWYFATVAHPETSEPSCALILGWSRGGAFQQYLDLFKQMLKE